RGRGTASVSARRLRVEWSGIARARPGRVMTEPISLSICRSASRSVSAVAMPRAEVSGWPPRVVRGSAFQAAIAASVNQTVRLARWGRAAS
ncbi:MAG: hypothetical protein ACRYHQ_35925, partial [Janthinobacterium lividum]